MADSPDAPSVPEPDTEAAASVDPSYIPHAVERPRRLTTAVVAGLDHPVALGFLVTIGVLIALVLGLAVTSIGAILVYVVLAMFLAVGLDPLVRRLERNGMKRGAAIAIVFCGFAVVMAALLIFVFPPVLAQIGQLITAVPEAIAAIPQSAWFAALDADTQQAVLAGIDQAGDWITAPATLAHLGGGLLSAGIGLIGAVSATFIVVALTLYFLASLAASKRALYALAPARSRARVEDLTDRITGSVGSALLGSVTLSIINAAVVFVLHLLIGLPFPALMAVIAFVITLIPLFGSVIFLVLGSLVALFTSPLQALIFAICYLVYIQIESYVVSPRVMNKAISIPPALVLIGALVGGALLGIVGVLLALPVIASLLLILREVIVPRQNLKV